MTKEEKLVWKEMQKLGWDNKPTDFQLEHFKDVIQATKKAFSLNSVVSSKITALVTYCIWQDSGHAMMDDYKKTLTKVVKVNDLVDIEELFSNVVKIEIIK